MKSDNRARDVEIYAKRQTGRTLQSLANEYGLSKEQIRQIECRQERGVSRFSARAMNTLRNAGLGDPEADPEATAKRLADYGRKNLLQQPNFGKATIKEIDAWMATLGYRAVVPLRPCFSERRWLRSEADNYDATTNQARTAMCRGLARMADDIRGN